MRSDVLVLQPTFEKHIEIPQMYLPYLNEYTVCLNLLKPFGCKVVTVSKLATAGKLQPKPPEDRSSAAICAPAVTNSFSVDNTGLSL